MTGMAPGLKSSDEQRQSSAPASAPAAARAPAAASADLTPMVGSADDGRVVGRHAALLSDPRLATTPNQAQRALLMRQMQRGYGNAHVARVIARMRDAGAVGVVQRDCPPVVERPPVAPAQHPGLQQVTKKVGQQAAAEKQHPPAKARADEAQAAATGPANEVASQAAANQVDKMGQQQPGVFDKKAFVEAVRKAIEAAAPKNLDEADKYKSSGKAAQVKGQVVGQVKSGKETAEKDIKQTTQAAPEPGGAQPKPVTPLKPAAAGPAPAAVGAATAMPAPKPADEVSLKPEQCATDSQMKEAGVTEQQLAKSNEPQFNDALAAKKQADAHTAAAPPAHRADEKGTLDQAKADATGAAGVAMGSMRAGKLGALAQVATQQGATKAKDEADRAKVAADLEAIYGRAKADVTKILDGLEGKVTTAFDAGEKAAREAMESHIDDKTTSFKLKRYLLQPGGLALWVVDQFSKPPELDAIVDAGVKLFTSKMDGVINQVADIVGAELTAARNRIAQGRTEIKQHVASLPKNLQKIGQEAAA
ncbi:MAG: hypothetical protein IT340_08955, partial [Chloroflexi bacterium]|nr:hypothetical protein [Chloroflexota bacterium]